MRWMSIEFDRHCGTAQSEDCLQLYIPAVTQHSNSTSATAADDDDDDDNGDGGGGGGGAVSAWWPVLNKFHGTDGWPASAVILPGDTRVQFLQRVRIARNADVLC